MGATQRTDVHSLMRSFWIVNELVNKKASQPNEKYSSWVGQIDLI